jgi:hypothetical protein
MEAILSSILSISETRLFHVRREKETGVLRAKPQFHSDWRNPVSKSMISRQSRKNPKHSIGHRAIAQPSHQLQTTKSHNQRGTFSSSVKIRVIRVRKYYPIFVPHSGQNLAPCASVPQLGHLVEASARSIFVPQLGQNFAPAVGVPHLGQLSSAG